jgi:hypothetical protein
MGQCGTENEEIVTGSSDDESAGGLAGEFTRDCRPSLVNEHTRTRMFAATLVRSPSITIKSSIIGVF